MKDLKLVYKAISKDLAEQKLLELEEKWKKDILLSSNLGRRTGNSINRY